MGKLSGIVAASAVPFGLLAAAVGTKGRCLGALQRPAQAVLAYTCATGLVVSVASTKRVNITGLLGKTEAGSLPWWSHAVLWPYHVGLRLKLAVQRSVSEEPLMDEVLPGWYLSGWPEGAAALPEGLAGVVDCTCELPRRHDIEYLCLPTWDTNAVTPEDIERAAEFVARVGGGRAGGVLIHCAHGHGRSAAVMCGCMAAVGAAGSIEEAEGILKAGRPLMKLNKDQRAALVKWDQQRRKRG